MNHNRSPLPLEFGRGFGPPATLFLLPTSRMNRMPRIDRHSVDADGVLKAAMLEAFSNIGTNGSRVASAFGSPPKRAS
jgi:hypothetical protein